MLEYAAFFRINTTDIYLSLSHILSFPSIFYHYLPIVSNFFPILFIFFLFYILKLKQSFCQPHYNIWMMMISTPLCRILHIDTRYWYTSWFIPFCTYLHSCLFSFIFFHFLPIFIIFFQYSPICFLFFPYSKVKAILLSIS